MSTPSNYDKGPIQGSAAEGYDRAYERARPQADAELKTTLAGRSPVHGQAGDQADDQLGDRADDTELKNPGDEFAVPAPSTKRPRATPGPHHPQDPEGRQGGYPPTDARPDRQPDGT
jgi:hypothetical protein